MTLEDFETGEKKKKEEEMEVEKSMKTSLSEYATNTLSQSLVTGVSNIVETKNKFRKFFKTAVLLFCTCGFFYQATLFVQFILTYPSVVDIDVYVPDKFVRPAYTFCNNNGIKRTKFCAKYPERCYVPEPIDEYCKKYSFFCSTLKNSTNFTVVKPEYYSFEKNISFEELKELGHDDTFMATNIFPEEMTGPYLVRKDDGVLVTCYTKYLRVESSLEAQESKKPDRLHKVLDEFYFDPEPAEVFIPDRFSGMLFNLHSPFVLHDPFQNGIFVRIKRTYIVHLRLEEEHLLPYPYSSDCGNYSAEWEKRNRVGPRSQEACIEKCELEFTYKDCNCTFPEVYYPSEGPFCTFKYYYCHKDDDELRIELERQFAECNALCKDDCQKFKYRFDYQVRLMEPDHSSEEGANEFIAKVKVIAADPEVVKLKYRPQYQDLEVFSNLGGFVGAWLGVSLVAIMDFFEALTMIAHFAFLKRQSTKRSAEK